MTKKSLARQQRDAAAAASDNTDYVDKVMNEHGHYENNMSFAETRKVHEGLVLSILQMQGAIAEELEVPGIMLCFDPAEESRVKLAINGLASDFTSFFNDLQKVEARYKDKGDRATNQDDVFLAMSLAEEYLLFTTRMTSVIQPTYIYLTTQIGVARQKLDGILKNMAAKQAAEKAAADATDPAVVTDVEVKSV